MPNYEKILQLYKAGPKDLSDAQLWELKGQLDSFMSQIGADDDLLAILDDVNNELDRRDEQCC